ncbi:hypothetical protein H257_17136 [Aphanomyces astaci]|uniref:BTB domain-containing protein n=1 Tax=Aphanomyces astaci TaxID=112090 RepID=W4FFW5_APHAT|nr:hypothetical protein H257_17136 [Aphanomyces astaci]ETV66335.1 hypothetical protein H257_17136 [Aphanomyces astaci]|eukprot:XP_009844110.1 hypothetical protein H257_17136 [Aphanomyces astaci]
MSSTFAIDMNAVKAHIDAVQSKVEEWNTQQVQHAAFQAHIQHKQAMHPSTIALDVGGMMYKTSKATLLAVQDSYFHALLASEHWTPDDASRGAYFLDLHGPTFARVLDFLRTGHLSVDGLNRWEVRQLHASLEYLQLVDATLATTTTTGGSTWTWDVVEPCQSSTVHLSRDRKVLHIAAKPSVSSTRTDRSWFVRGSAPVISFRVQVLGMTTLTVGFCPVTCTTGIEAIKVGRFLTFTSSVVPQRLPSSQHKCNLCDVIGVHWGDDKVTFERNDSPVGTAFVSILSTTDHLVPFVSSSRFDTTTLYIID